MVATRKPPVAPVPTGSRSNSTQAVPRASKPKTSSSLANSSEAAPKEPQPPAAQNGVSSQKTHSKSRHKNRHLNHKKPPKPSRGLLDTLVYIFLVLFAVYSFTTCPQDEHLSNPICRSLSQYRTHVLEPYILPPIERALAHPSVAPYVTKAQRIERESIRPVVIKGAQISGPYATHAKRLVWDKTTVPAFYAYVVPQWRKHVLPPWNKHVSPHIARAAPHVARARRTLEDSATASHKFYSKRVQPALVRTYAVARPYAVQTYVTVKPHAVALYAGLAAQAGAARRAYVDPHVVRIWEKVLELSGAGPVGSPASQAAPPIVNKAVTTSQTTQAKTLKAPETKTAEAATSSVSAEEPVASEIPQATPSSSASVDLPAETTADAAIPAKAHTTETETVASVEAETETVEPVSSAASVVLQSAHSKETFVVEDLTTSASSAAPSPSSVAAAASIEPELSAASIAVQSAHGMESAVVEEIIDDIKATQTESAFGAIPIATELVEEEEPEDDFSDFLEDLGLSDEPAQQEPEDSDEEMPELSDEELRALQRQEAEEKIRKTATKRADLEARMAKSSATLSAMAKDKTKQLRKALVGMRKAAVAKMDNADTEIGGTLPALQKDGEKLLKGLEGYLKKELKNKGADVEERTERWNTVVGKLEDKLSEKIQVAQAVVHEFHAELRNAEVNEGMALIDQVTGACSQAQGDVGLDLSWLDDVTVKDWQVYHDLARIGEKFQAEASEIQAGTHSHPPVDPFVPRLKQMEDNITEIIHGFVGRIHALKLQAEAAFEKDAIAPEPVPEPEISILPVDDMPPPPPPVAGEIFDPAHVVIGKSPEQVTEALRNVVPEPEVSILPVDDAPPPPPPAVGDTDKVDPAQVVLGKSAEQVAQALHNAEGAVVHEEL